MSELHSGNGPWAKPRIFVVVAKYLRADGSVEIGGVESYVTQLALALSQQYQVVVCQRSAAAFRKSLGLLDVIGMVLPSLPALLNRLEQQELQPGDVLLISSEQLNVVPRWPQTLVIQHGIYWDLHPQFYSSSRIACLLPGPYKLLDNLRNRRRMAPYRHIVCVDHCYGQWYRSLGNDAASAKQFHTILNHAADGFFSTPPRAGDGQVRVLFSRRFMRFRGTLVFCAVVRRLLGRYPQLAAGLCGYGPDQARMQEILPEGERVRYFSAAYRDMPNVLAEHDIVVVPSLGSEGSSLSVIEGMAAGRVVVASAVGGIANLIIHEYNGFLVKPGDEDDLFDTVSRLVEDQALRVQVGERGRQMASAAFAFEPWARKWREIVDKVAAAS